MNKRGGMMSSIFAVGAIATAIFGMIRGFRNGTFQPMLQSIMGTMNAQGAQPMAQPLQSIMSNQSGQQQQQSNQQQSNQQQSQKSGNNNANMNKLN